MGVWSFLFGARGVEPLARVDDPTFGAMLWSEDAESWVGTYGGYEIAIGYSGTSFPDPALLKYAREFLGEDGVEFEGTFNAAKIAHAAEFQRWEDEFAQLRVETIFFGRNKDKMGCQVSLDAGIKNDLDRSWRVEFLGEECLGFGFDT